MQGWAEGQQKMKSLSVCAALQMAHNIHTAVMAYTGSATYRVVLGERQPHGWLECRTMASKLMRVFHANVARQKQRRLSVSGLQEAG